MKWLWDNGYGQCRSIELVRNFWLTWDYWVVMNIWALCSSSLETDIEDFNRKTWCIRWSFHCWWFSKYKECPSDHHNCKNLSILWNSVDLKVWKEKEWLLKKIKSKRNKQPLTCLIRKIVLEATPEVSNTPFLFLF